ncbi:MAG TPA: hypothetical protein VH088_14280 [Terriglobales bacterium]|jgi:hypothetical protein|nr:hypothetical protein [Terriglobales bacterium]
MSSRLHLLSSWPEPPIIEQEPPVFPGEFSWDARNFAQEQIRRLVRQVFFPGWPHPARHVGFVGIDEAIDTGAICIEVGHVLATEIQANTCVIEASRSAAHGLNSSENSRVHRVAGRLWQMPQSVFLEGGGSGMSAVWLENRLEKVRSDFDFTLLNLPSADRSSEALLLGHLSDGVILVVEAHSTRRVKAQMTKDLLQAANVRILGTVLNGRRFPIPEKIYRRL